MILIKDGCIMMKEVKGLDELISSFDIIGCKGDSEEEFKFYPELLLHPNIPKPLHGVNPRSINGNKWWNRVRKETYAKHDFRCFACGVERYSQEIMFSGWLEAHEYYEIDYVNCSVEFVKLVALCQCCHMGIHTGRLGAMFDKGQYDEETCYLVLNRKDQVLNGMINMSGNEIDFRVKHKTQKQVDQFFIDTWSKWHLNLNGKKYYSKFKNVDEWRSFYEKM